MEIMLDTNAYADWRRGLAWSEECSSCERLYLSAVMMGELEFGFTNGKNYKENKRMLSLLIQSPKVDVCVIDLETTEIFGEFCAYLKRAGTPIPTNDIWIAASAFQRQAMLLTKDKHFAYLPQISVHIK